MHPLNFCTFTCVAFNQYTSMALYTFFRPLQAGNLPDWTVNCVFAMTTLIFTCTFAGPSAVNTKGNGIFADGRGHLSNGVFKNLSLWKSVSMQSAKNLSCKNFPLCSMYVYEFDEVAAYAWQLIWAMGGGILLSIMSSVSDEISFCVLFCYVRNEMRCFWSNMHLKVWIFCFVCSSLLAGFHLGGLARILPCPLELAWKFCLYIHPTPSPSHMS